MKSSAKLQCQTITSFEINVLADSKLNICVFVNPEKDDLFANNVWGFAGMKIDKKPVPIEQDIPLDDILKKYDFVIYMKCLYNQKKYDILYEQINESIVDLYFSIPNESFGNNDFDPLLVPMWSGK